MSVYDEKPWLSLYDLGQPAEIALEFTDALSMFRASVSRNPDGDIIRYFGGRITARELDELSDAFAVALAGLGVRAGDRVALYVQNVPQFVIAMLAAWKAGGIAVPVNPMNRARELDAVLRDSGTRRSEPTRRHLRTGRHRVPHLHLGHHGAAEDHPRRRPRPRSSSPSAASRWPPTSTPARSSSSTSCPRPSPASSCAANSATAASGLPGSAGMACRAGGSLRLITKVVTQAKESA